MVAQGANVVLNLRGHIGCSAWSIASDVACVKQELDLTLEEEFLDLLLKLVRELPLADIYQMDAHNPHSAPTSYASRPKQSALEVSPPIRTPDTASAAFGI